MTCVKTGINRIVAFLEKRFTILAAFYLQQIICFIVIPAACKNKQDNQRKQKNVILNLLHTVPINDGTSGSR
jgi:hypothetical protein